MMPEGESSFGSAFFGSPFSVPPLSVPPSGDPGSRSCACCVYSEGEGIKMKALEEKILAIQKLSALVRRR